MNPSFTYLVGDGGCPEAGLIGIVDGDDDMELVEPGVKAASLGPKLATDLQEPRSTRCVQLSVPRGIVSSQGVLVNLVAQFRRKLEQMRL